MTSVSFTTTTPNVIYIAESGAANTVSYETTMSDACFADKYTTTYDKDGTSIPKPSWLHPGINGIGPHAY